MHIRSAIRSTASWSLPRRKLSISLKLIIQRSNFTGAALALSLS
ncbi:hypothetical protein [Endozoicomonas sp. ALB115]